MSVAEIVARDILCSDTAEPLPTFEAQHVTASLVGSISAAFSTPVYVPPREEA